MLNSKNNNNTSNGTQNPGIRVCVNTDDSLCHSDIRIEPRTIWVTEFNTESAKQFTTDINEAHSTGQTVIPVVVDSFGGDVYSLLSMIADISAAELPVATIARSKAMSAGSFLTAAGTPGYRYADPECTFMIHEVGSATWGKVVDLRADTAEAQRLNRRLFDMLDRQCDQAPGYFAEQVHNNGHADLYWTANQARRHRLIDHVRIPKFTVDVHCEWKLA